MWLQLQMKKASASGRLFWGENFRELVCGTGVSGSTREAYDDPLAARNVRLRVSGAQAIETIMPINKTPARIIMV
jgi:hypothetical protein